MADNDDLYADLYADADPAPPSPTVSKNAQSSSVTNGQSRSDSRQNNTGSSRNDQDRQNSPARLNNPSLPPAGTRADIPEAGRLDDGKMFIGGLSWDTTDDGLKDYFEQFGKISQCTVMRDPTNGRSRGFAFLTFEDSTSVNEVMVRNHFLDGKTIDPKRAIPRKEESRTDKLFVRNIPPGVTQPMFQDFFAKFGVLSDCTLMMDRDTNEHRGFGFVTYKSEETVDKVVNGQPYSFLGQQIEVKKSAGRARDERRGGYERGGRDNAFGSNNNWNGGGGAGGMGNMGNMGGMNNQAMQQMMAGFDPNAMSEYFKSMGWPSFNPMMMMNPMMFGNMMGNMPGTTAGGSGQDSSSSRSRPSPKDAPTGPRAETGPSRSSGRNDSSYHPYSRGDRSDRGDRGDRDRSDRDR